MGSRLRMAHPIDLVEAVDYQDEAVVSRTLVKSDAGTVTLFAFDKDQELSEHTAPFDALIQILDGSAEITISGELSIVCTGQMLIVPANEPHTLRAPERFKMLLTMIKART